MRGPPGAAAGGGHQLFELLNAILEQRRLLGLPKPLMSFVAKGFAKPTAMIAADVAY